MHNLEEEGNKTMNETAKTKDERWSKQFGDFTENRMPLQGKTKNIVSKIDYWQEFVKYAFLTVPNSLSVPDEFYTALPADRSCHALTFGTSKAYIELSFSTQKRSLRTALLVSDKSVFAEMEKIIDKFHFTDTVVLDRESKTASISLIKKEVDITEKSEEQFAWFLESAQTLKKLADTVLK